MKTLRARTDSFLRRFYMRSELAAEDYTDEKVDGSGRRLYIDKEGSVSANGHGPEPLWPEMKNIDDQERRFLHAS